MIVSYRLYIWTFKNIALPVATTNKISYNIINGHLLKVVQKQLQFFICNKQWFSKKIIFNANTSEAKKF